MFKKISSLLLVIACFLLILSPSKIYASEEMDIFDVMTEHGQPSDVNESVMEEANTVLQNTVGKLMSVVIYLIFAMVGFNTAVDLLYISVPFTRPFLYSGSVAGNKVGSANASLIGRNEAWTQMANNNMARANMHLNNAQAYQNLAQQRAMTGDVDGANRAMRYANNESGLANQQVRHANENMNMQAWSDDWRGRANQRSVENAQNRAEQNSR